MLTHFIKPQCHSAPCVLFSAARPRRALLNLLFAIVKPTLQGFEQSSCAVCTLCSAENAQMAALFVLYCYGPRSLFPAGQAYALASLPARRGSFARTVNYGIRISSVNNMGAS